MSVLNDLELLRQAARVSPPLKEAVARVDAEVERLIEELQAERFRATQQYARLTAERDEARE